MPYSLLKEMLRIIISLTLNILRHSKANSACIGRVCKHTHSVNARCHKLLRAKYSVKIMANALESICYRSAVVIKKFCLLQNRVRLTACKSVAGQNEKRYSVSSCTATGSYHIGSARPDRRYTGNNCLSVHLLCISNSGKSHILLIFTLIKFKIMTALLQSLTNADNTAVAENAKHTADKLCFNTVTFDILIVEELNKRLRHSKSYSFHRLCLNFRKFNRSVLSNRKLSSKTQTKSLKTVINSSLSRLIINHAVNKLCHLVSKRLHISFEEEI